ncbi:MAG: hypothetical protein ACFFA0_03750 [Promethearchaeota archaeon]
MSEKKDKCDKFLKDGYVLYKNDEPFIESEIIREFGLNLGEGTGSFWNIDEIKTRDCLFDRYVVTVGLSPNNEFLGIIEINVNEDFRSSQAKLRSQKYHNLEELSLEK